MGGALNIGMIGVGNISAQYFAELPKLGGSRPLHLLAVSEDAYGASHERILRPETHEALERIRGPRGKRSMSPMVG